MCFPHLTFVLHFWRNLIDGHSIIHIVSYTPTRVIDRQQWRWSLLCYQTIRGFQSAHSSLRGSERKIQNSPWRHIKLNWAIMYYLCTYIISGFPPTMGMDPEDKDLHETETNLNEIIKSEIVLRGNLASNCVGFLFISRLNWALLVGFTCWRCWLQAPAR